MRKAGFSLLAALCSASTAEAADAIFLNGFELPNLAFVTSTTQTGNLGGLAGADAICQTRAANAALSGTYRAYLSTSGSDALLRIDRAGGWTRVDGLPVANTAEDFANGRFMYPLRITESGVDVGDSVAMTATNAGLYDGSGACNDFTATAGSVFAGTPAAQSSMFSTFSTTACSSPSRLYCLGIDRAGSVSIVPPPTRRLAFTTVGAWTPGSGRASADALCQSEAGGAGLSGTYLAVLASTTSSAAARFNTSGAAWARVDGARLTASASTTFSASYWDTSPGLSADGSLHFGNLQVWGGAANLASVGTAGSTCNDWTSTTGFGGGGRAGYSWLHGLFAYDAAIACSSIYSRLVCMQQ
jgi:hypothetical protein